MKLSPNGTSYVRAPSLTCHSRCGPMPYNTNGSSTCHSGMEPLPQVDGLPQIHIGRKSRQYALAELAVRRAQDQLSMPEQSVLHVQTVPFIFGVRGGCLGCRRPPVPLQRPPQPDGSHSKLLNHTLSWAVRACIGSQQNVSSWDVGSLNPLK
jgi:hypothetical protein